MQQKVDVSIVVPVYNHEKYITHALYSIYQQQVKFKYEVLIGEDCSTDNSRAILKKIEKEFPSNFHFYYYEHNMGGKGLGNLNFLYSKMEGKYFCVLEGDDFWIYNKKLQEQFDFLEKNTDFIAVAHNTKVVDENDNELKWKYPECKNEIFTVSDYEHGLMVGQTATLFMRNYYKLNLFDYNLSSPKLVGDRQRNFLLFCNGKVRCIQKKWSAYRLVLTHGSSFSANSSRLNTRDELDIYLKFYKYVKDHNIAPQKYNVVENEFFYFLFKKVIAREISLNFFFEYYNKTNRKLDIKMYLAKKMLVRPIYNLKKRGIQKKYYKNK